MNNVIATPPPPAPSAAGNATTAVAVLDANPALASLETGSLVQGVVIGRDSRGQTVLETEFGQVTLTSRIALPVGSDVVLQIQNAGARLMAIILSVNDQPVASLGRLPLPPLPSLANPPPSQAPGPAGAEPAAEVTLSAGTITTATVLRPATPTGASPAGQQSVAASPGTSGPTAAPRLTGVPVSSGSQFSVRIVAIEPPAAPVAGATLAVPAAEIPPPAELQSTSTGTEPTLAPAPSALDPASLPPGRLSGVVLRNPGNGQVEIRTELGLLELALAAEPPVGSLVLLEALGLPRVPTASPNLPPGAPTAPPAAALAEEWPALRDALAALVAAAEGEAHPTASPVPDLPQVGPELSLGLLAFLAAIESNDSGALLRPETIKQLEEAGAGHLVGQLRDDLGRLSQLAGERGPGDWRSFFVPIQDDLAVRQICIFVKRREARPQGQRGAKPEPAASRFVIELELSRLGALQLDGFLKGKRLNLILRSRRRLPDLLRDSLCAVFNEANLIAGLDGTLGFQDELAQFPLAPLDALRSRPQAVVV